MNSKKAKTSESKKEKIPAALRNAVWMTYMGNIAEGKCCCCKLVTIGVGNFECGHVIAESTGGETNIANLRPICGGCNKSMGVKNMIDFMTKSGFGELKGKVASKGVNDDSSDAISANSAAKKKGEKKAAAIEDAQNAQIMQNKVTWNNMYVPDLKYACEILGISKQGRKIDLVERLSTWNYNAVLRTVVGPCSIEQLRDLCAKNDIKISTSGSSKREDIMAVVLSHDKIIPLRDIQDILSGENADAVSDVEEGSEYDPEMEIDRLREIISGLSYMVHGLSKIANGDCIMRFQIEEVMKKVLQVRENLRETIDELDEEIDDEYFRSIFG